MHSPLALHPIRERLDPGVGPMPVRLEDWIARLRGQPDAFLLESGLDPAGMGRRHYLGCGSIGHFRVHGSRWELRVGDRVEHGTGSPWDAFATWWESWAAAEDEPERTSPPRERRFDGGAVGFLSYEFGELNEGLPPREDADRTPDVDLRLYDEVVQIDAETGEATLVHRGRAGLEARRWWEAHPVAASTSTSTSTSTQTAGEQGPAMRPEDVTYSIGEEDYLRAVESIRQSIADGDVYEVNLTRRESHPGPVDPWDLHAVLREKQPVPYGAVLAWSSLGVVSASPERFLARSGTHVATRPIKGTAPRSGDADQDRAAAAALLASPKERAELAMIIDLERNDLGKLCRAGSVRVAEEAGVEMYSTVIHTVATVEGELDPGVSPVDLLRATFPGGSITGAPKLASMKFIREHEPVPRSVYTGSIGWIDPRGDLDLSIAIRTVLLTGDRTEFSVGGAVTWGSNPAAEYRELEAKGRAIRASLRNLP